jgi:protein SCO1/2
LSASVSQTSRLAAAVLLAMVVSGWITTVSGRQDTAPLSKIGPAPDFTLTNQDGKPFSLSSLRGKVAAVTFIFTGCGNTCPLLTAKMVSIQKSLGTDFGPKVFFASITVDPLADTPEILKRYANAHGANLGGWAFLTGTPAQITDVAHRYGIYYKKQSGDDIDHTFLTSIVDRKGTLRVQYLGVRFDDQEFLQDIQSLLREDGGQ